jgi:hypothetical protein
MPNKFWTGCNNKHSRQDFGNTSSLVLIQPLDGY